MTKRNIMLSDELYSKLKKCAESKSVPIITIIRESCEEYLKNKQLNFRATLDKKEAYEGADRQRKAF